MKHLAVFLIFLSACFISLPAMAAALPAPTEVKAEVVSDPEGLCAHITWKASKGATGYDIYRARADIKDDFGRIGKSTTTSFKDFRIETGKKYMYYVVATAQKNLSDKSEIVTVNVSEAGAAPAKTGMGANPSKDYVLDFAAYWNDKNESYNEYMILKLADNTIWIARADNVNPNYPPFVNMGVLPTFPKKSKDAVISYGANLNYRFVFYYVPGSDVYICSSKHQTNWTEWSPLGELPAPAGYKPGKFKFTFGVSRTWFCCVALDTETMHTYEAVCAANSKSWSPWKATGKIGLPRYVKKPFWWCLAYDEKIYYALIVEPTTNTISYSIFDGTSWKDWTDAAQKPRLPEWILPE